MRRNVLSYWFGLRTFVACVLPVSVGCAGAQRPCPADLDRDGYIGSADLCPAVREDGKGDEPRDGCPEEGPMVVVAPKPEPEPAPAPAPVAPEPALPPLPILPRERVLAELDRRDLPPCAGEPEVTTAVVEAPRPEAATLPTLPRLSRDIVLAELATAEEPVALAPCASPAPPPPRPSRVAVRAPAKPRRIVVDSGEIKLNEKILFDTGLATINPSSDSLLESLATAIKDNPDIEYIEIAGHADKRGGDYYNLDLTRRRAQSVMQRLIALGVESRRLRAVGYGSYCPVSAAETEEAYEQSRRVEFKILRRNGKDLSPGWGGCAEAQTKGLSPLPIPPSAPRG